MVLGKGALLLDRAGGVHRTRLARLVVEDGVLCNHVFEARRRKKGAAALTCMVFRLSKMMKSPVVQR